MINQFVKEIRCLICKGTKAPVCKICGACTSCNGCRAGRCTAGIPALYRGMNFTRNPLRRALGLEYEIASYSGALQALIETHVHNGSYVFSRHRDGSVKPSESEWVTALPIVGDHALDVMTFMSKALATSQTATTNTSCGFHVHVDACKETSHAIRKFLWMYLTMEESIYNLLVHPYRQRASACVPLMQFIRSKHRGFQPGMLLEPPYTKPAGFMGFILSLYGINCVDRYDFMVNRNFWRGLRENIHAFGYDRANNPRYCGMNLHSWYARGSIEWRMKEQTVKPHPDGGDDLVMWPLFCGWFTNIGLTESISMLTSQYTSLEAFAESPLIPKDLAAWLKQRMAWRKVNVPPTMPPPPGREGREARPEFPGGQLQAHMVLVPEEDEDPPETDEEPDINF